MRRKLNADEKGEPAAGELHAFVRQYVRKAYPQHDPNDRSYSRDTEKRIERMKPADLDRLLHDDEI